MEKALKLREGKKSILTKRGEIAMLTEKFHKNFKENILEKNEFNDLNEILQSVDWEHESKRCFDLIIKCLMENGEVGEVGVFEFGWVDHENGIYMDFMPDNDLDIAFEEGSIHDIFVVDNESFFKKYFNTHSEGVASRINEKYGKGSFEKVIKSFYYILEDISDKIVETEVFKQMPKKFPFYMVFFFFHDDEEYSILYKGN